MGILMELIIREYKNRNKWYFKKVFLKIILKYNKIINSNIIMIVIIK